jgi:4-carboxymuconolactone decarboxylase
MIGDQKRFDDGLAIRRDVLGAAHVDRSMASATSFTRPLQDLVTEYCWGAIWARSGLERKTRSLLNVAMLTALNQHHELGLHVEGALRNGATVEEVREVLLQAAIYCGVPAAIAASRTATEAIARHLAETTGPGGDGTPA